MKLYSVREDFEVKTLAAIPGLLGRLRYVAGLRKRNGTYQHWGLERVYGTAAAQRAMSEVHRNVMMQVMRAPVRELFEDAAQSAEGAGLSVAELLHEIDVVSRELPPEVFGGGSARHFNTVLQALELLESSCRDANLRVS